MAMYMADIQCSNISPALTHTAVSPALSYTNTRTRRYASPELLSRQQTYDESIDLWGLGLILFIVLSGKHPFEEASDVYHATGLASDQIRSDQIRSDQVYHAIGLILLCRRVIRAWRWCIGG